jgi:hypothetical protein
VLKYFIPFLDSLPGKLKIDVYPMVCEKKKIGSNPFATWNNGSNGTNGSAYLWDNGYAPYLPYLAKTV